MSLLSEEERRRAAAGLEDEMTLLGGPAVKKGLTKQDRAGIVLLCVLCE